MKKINEKLSEIFDVEPIKEEVKNSTEVALIDDNNPVDTDTDYARKNIRNLIERGTGAVDEILTVARDSQHPRAYEVAAALIKNMADLNKDLLELQKRKQELQLPTNKSNSKDLNIDKAVFVGSTAELMKLLKK